MGITCRQLDLTSCKFQIKLESLGFNFVDIAKKHIQDNVWIDEECVEDYSCICNY